MKYEVYYNDDLGGRTLAQTDTEFVAWIHYYKACRETIEAMSEEERRERSEKGECITLNENDLEGNAEPKILARTNI